MNIKKIIASVMAGCIVCGGVLSVVTAGNAVTTVIAADYTTGTYGELEYNNYEDHIEIIYFGENATDVVIPAEINKLPVTVVSIGMGAAQYLKSLTIPDSVEKIGSFYFCPGFTSINVSENNKYYSSIDGVLFNKDKTELIIYPAGRTETEYTIPDGVIEIGHSAFIDCVNLTSVIIPDSVMSIEYGAFVYCANLTSVNIPENVEYIEDVAFHECGIESIIIPESVTYIGESAFSRCPDLKTIKILNPECEIYDNYSTISNEESGSKYYFNGTIYGYANSTAQAYAEKYEYAFKLLGDSPEISVTETALIGDANEDGKVTIADAAAIIQALGNPDKYALTAQGMANADCYNPGDGVTALDALAIQKLESRQLAELPEMPETE